MIGSLFVSLVALAVLSSGLQAAQPGSKPGGKPIPVSVANGTPGVNIEFYLNSGKLADATVNATGGANWLLDISNLGKTRIDIYVDVCKDGKVVQVKFVSGNGQKPPEDEGCDRKVAAVSFQSDCGVISINLDFRNFGAKLIGCGMKFTDPKILTTIGGVVLGGVLVGVSGGGDTTATSVTARNDSPTPQTTSGSGTTPGPATGGAPPPANNTDPGPGANTPPPGTVFTIVVGTAHFHFQADSLACFDIATDPPRPGATISGTVSGPGVVSGAAIAGVLDAAGRYAHQAGIAAYGTYTANGMVAAADGITRPFSGTANVGPGQGTCQPRR